MRMKNLAEKPGKKAHELDFHTVFIITFGLTDVFGGGKIFHTTIFEKCFEKIHHSSSSSINFIKQIISLEKAPISQEKTRLTIKNLTISKSSFFVKK
jgi:hypothetical protein